MIMCSAVPGQYYIITTIQVKTKSIAHKCNSVKNMLLIQSVSRFHVNWQKDEGIWYSVDLASITDSVGVKKRIQVKPHNSFIYHQKYWHGIAKHPITHASITSNCWLDSYNYNCVCVLCDCVLILKGKNNEYSFDGDSANVNETTTPCNHLWKEQKEMIHPKWMSKNNNHFVLQTCTCVQ